MGWTPWTTPWTRALGVLGLVAGAVVGAHAATVEKLSFEQVVERSTEVFVGTVLSKKVVEGGEPRNLILTEVKFHELDVLKGDLPGKTKRYRFAGGTLGDRTLTVPGVPQFELGGRYVLFADDAGDGVCPAVGWWQGRYQVHRDPESGAEYVLDSNGCDTDSKFACEPGTHPAGHEPVRVALADFMTRIRETVKVQAAARIAEPAPEQGDAEDAEKGGEVDAKEPAPKEAPPPTDEPAPAPAPSDVKPGVAR